MRLEEIMRKKVITVSPDTTIANALILLRENRIRHLPVVEHDRLVGVISDRDIREALPSSLFPHANNQEILHTPVSEIMQQNVIIAHPLDFIDDAAKAIYEHKVGSLPLVADNRLVGIVTESDILNSIVELFGVNKPSSVIEVIVDDLAGQLADVSKVFGEAGVNVVSVIVSPCPLPNKKKLVFRIQTIDPRKLIQQLTSQGFTVADPVKGGILP